MLAIVLLMAAPVMPNIGMINIPKIVSIENDKSIAQKYIFVFPRDEITEFAMGLKHAMADVNENKVKGIAPSTYEGPATRLIVGRATVANPTANGK